MTVLLQPNPKSPRCHQGSFKFETVHYKAVIGHCPYLGQESVLDLQAFPERSLELNHSNCKISLCIQFCFPSLTSLSPRSQTGHCTLATVSEQVGRWISQYIWGLQERCMTAEGPSLGGKPPFHGLQSLPG